MFECWDSCVSSRQKMSIAKVANHYFFSQPHLHVISHTSEIDTNEHTLVGSYVTLYST